MGLGKGNTRVSYEFQLCNLMESELGDVVEQTRKMLSSELVLTLPEEEEYPELYANYNLFLARVCSDKPVGRGLIRDVIQQLWRSRAEWTVEEVRPGMFKMRFWDMNQLKFVLDKRPWAVKGNQMIIRRWPPELRLTEVNMDLCPFWVQGHGLPPKFQSEKMAKELAPLIGDFLQYHQGWGGRGGMGDYLRMQCEVDVSKPLMAGFFLNRGEGHMSWIQFKYERLANFCYKCGKIGHGQGDCKEIETAMVNSIHGPKVVMYGPRLRSESRLESCFEVEKKQTERYQNESG